MPWEIYGLKYPSISADMEDACPLVRTFLTEAAGLKGLQADPAVGSKKPLDMQGLSRSFRAVVAHGSWGLLWCWGWAQTAVVGALTCQSMHWFWQHPGWQLAGWTDELSSVRPAGALASVCSMIPDVFNYKAVLLSKVVWKRRTSPVRRALLAGNLVSN